MTLSLVLLLLAAEEDPESLEDRTRALEEKLELLTQQLEETRAQSRSNATRLDEKERFQLEVGGYSDLGFFMVQGNGSGVRKDFGHAVTGSRFAPLLDSWVLVGDPLSTTVNSRGDVADLGDSRAVTFDPIHSRGRPTFLVNAVNLSLKANIDETFFFTALIDFLPRDRAFGPGGLGDFIDVKLASARFDHRFSWGFFSLNAGKFDSLLGIEYRTQEAPQRLTVTPSMLCRYTCGRPLGLKARFDLFDSRLELGVALTNGSSEIEQFPFNNEVDFNIVKTFSARVAVRLPVGDFFEVSASGMAGAQDRQTSDSVLQWHVGAATHLDWRRLTVSAEYVVGEAKGRDSTTARCGVAACINYMGAYGLVGVRALQWLVPYVRVDWRNAAMQFGAQYAYLSRVARSTVGVRLEPHPRVTLKAEYTFNFELVGNQFPDDIFTTSFVLSL